MDFYKSPVFYISNRLGVERYLGFLPDPVHLEKNFMPLALRNDHDCDLYRKMGNFNFGGYSVRILVYWGCVSTHGSGYGESLGCSVALPIGKLARRS
jgi:hypothetical protein